jgi:hypothetical protein
VTELARSGSKQPVKEGIRVFFKGFLEIRRGITGGAFVRRCISCLSWGFADLIRYRWVKVIT